MTSRVRRGWNAVETWRGLRLRNVAPPQRDSWLAALLAPYLERRFSELMPGSSIASVQSRGNREAPRPTPPCMKSYNFESWRGDGKPLTGDGQLFR
jgi:hypothetical protein